MHKTQLFMKTKNISYKNIWDQMIKIKIISSIIKNYIKLKSRRSEEIIHFIRFSSNLLLI